jgi:CysZ protein
VSELAKGFHDVGRGFDFLKRHPSLWKWVVAPSLITLLLLIGAVIGVAALTEPLVTWATSHLPSFLETIAGVILTIVVVAGLSLAALLAFVSVAGMVAGPFNELLSEAVEARLTGVPGAPFSLGSFTKGAALGIVHGLRRVVTSLVGIVLLFALGLIPVIGTIAAGVIGLWLAGRGAAYDAYDAVLSRRELAYADKLAYLDRHRSRSLGLGLTIAGMLLVPGLNLVALGLGAAGATLACHELEASTARGSARA